MNESYKVEIDLLGGSELEKFTDKAVNLSGIFESGKRIATHDRFIITGNGDLKKLCETIAMAAIESGGYALFVGIRSVNDKRVSNNFAWFEKGVQSLSMFNIDGSMGWALFKDVLKELGYNAQTDEHMHVIAVEETIIEDSYIEKGVRINENQK